MNNFNGKTNMARKFVLIKCGQKSRYLCRKYDRQI